LETGGKIQSNTKVRIGKWSEERCMLEVEIEAYKRVCLDSLEASKVEPNLIIEEITVANDDLHLKTKKNIVSTGLTKKLIKT